MPGFDTRITNINPAWPIRPAQPGKRDGDRDRPGPRPRDEPPPGRDDAEDDSIPTIDEHV